MDEAANGADPSTAAQNGSTPADEPGTPFERFERLTRRLLAIPKSELERRRAAHTANGNGSAGSVRSKSAK